MVSLLLPPLFAGGAVNAEAPALAFYALCVADPFAWIASDSVLLMPFVRNILKMDYRYMHTHRVRREPEDTFAWRIRRTLFSVFFLVFSTDILTVMTK